MYATRQEIVTQDKVHKYAITRDQHPVSYREVIDLWRHDAAFRTFFCNLLADSPFTAFRWETPPVSINTCSRPFEFVLRNSPRLDRPADRNTFAQHFGTGDTGDEVVTFENLLNDAILIVPTPRGPDSAYVHLARFIRSTLESQKHALWQTVGQTLQQQLTDQPIWLNTAGGGVAWLHIRLDSHPKYYGYVPYKQDTV